MALTAVLNHSVFFLNTSASCSKSSRAFLKLPRDPCSILSRRMSGNHERTRDVTVLVYCDWPPTTDLSPEWTHDAATFALKYISADTIAPNIWPECVLFFWVFFARQPACLQLHAYGRNGHIVASARDMNLFWEHFLAGTPQPTHLLGLFAARRPPLSLRAYGSLWEQNNCASAWTIAHT